MGLFEKYGYDVTHDAENPQGDIAVVNTCGFIEDAKQESIDTILELAQAKEEGQLKHLYVMGCLSERYLADLEKEIPEVDGWYGKFNYKQLLKDLEKLSSSSARRSSSSRTRAATPSSSALRRATASCPPPSCATRTASTPPCW